MDQFTATIVVRFKAASPEDADRFAGHLEGLLFRLGGDAAEASRRHVVAAVEIPKPVPRPAAVQKGQIGSIFERSLDNEDIYERFC